MVEPSSPAERANLRVNDVILEFNGVRIEQDMHLISLVKLSEIGRRVPITVRLQSPLAIPRIVRARVPAELFSEPAINLMPGRISGTEHFRSTRRYDVETFPSVAAIRIDEAIRRRSSARAAQVEHAPRCVCTDTWSATGSSPSTKASSSSRTVWQPR